MLQDGSTASSIFQRPRQGRKGLTLGPILRRVNSPSGHQVVASLRSSLQYTCRARSPKLPPLDSPHEVVRTAHISVDFPAEDRAHLELGIARPLAALILGLGLDEGRAGSRRSGEWLVPTTEAEAPAAASPGGRYFASCTPGSS